MQKTNIDKKEYRILLWLFISIPIIDFLNGTLITQLNFSNDISLGKFYRILTVIFLSYILFKNSTKIERKKHIIIILVTVLIVCCYILIFFYYHRNFKGMLTDFISISKLLLIFIIIYVMSFLSRKELIKVDIFNKIFDSYLIIFPISMMVPYILGLGNSTYSSGLGYTGLYYANNDLSITLLISTIYGINNVIIKKNIKSIILSSLNLVSLLLVGSKTGIMGLFLAMFLYLIFYRKEIIICIKNIDPKNKILMILSFLLVVIVFYILFSSILIKVFDRIVYFYKKEGSVFAALLSGREKFLSLAIENFIQENLLFFKFLFGVGFSYRNNWGEGSLVEMDLIDIFFSLGLIVTIIIIYCIVKLVYKMVIILNRKNFMFFVCINIMILFSFLAGHVAFSAFSGSILALLISGMYLFSINDEFN